MASFTDGTSGMFVSNRVAIPEPSALLLLVLSISILVARPERQVLRNAIRSPQPADRTM